MLVPTPYVAALLCLLLSGAGRSEVLDADRDSLPDVFEQAILSKFLPRFQVSPKDCDGAPAEFEQGHPHPQVKAKNGTIYGQVFPVRGNGSAGAFLEIHYYHLWTRDCGKPAHALDAESVSAVVRAVRLEWRPDAWQAWYWYAAAHENTFCDMSNGGSASALNAVERGPEVWISRDKHASFLKKQLCTQGCGKDDCNNAAPFQTLQILNLGEPGSPLNGADWAASSLWPLALKMQPDFTEELIARMQGKDEVDVVPAREVARGMRTTIRVAGNTYWSLASANASTGTSVSSAVENASTAVSAAAVSTGGAIHHAGCAVKKSVSLTEKSIRRSFRWLGSGRPTEY